MTRAWYAASGSPPLPVTAVAVHLDGSLCARLLAAALALGVMYPHSVLAQQPDSTPPATSRWARGVTVMMPRVDGGGGLVLTAVGMSAGSLRTHTLGGDLAIVALPAGLAFAVLAGGIRANLAVPITVGRSSLLVPSAGASLLGAAGSGGFGGLAGTNGTLAVILFDRPLTEPGPSRGLRIAIASHRFGRNADAAVRILEIGFVKRGQ